MTGCGPSPRAARGPASPLGARPSARPGRRPGSSRPTSGPRSRTCTGARTPVPRRTRPPVVLGRSATT
eukprot:13959530-Alexandrium_andersonii.AAC.1